MPRKSSSLAASPLRKKRAKLIEKIGLDVSGQSQEDAVKQQGTELKKTTKTPRQSVLNVAGIKQPFISKEQGLAKRVVLGQSWNKHRKERPLYGSLGVEFESEKAERHLQNEITCGKIKVKRKKILCADKRTATEPVGYVGDDDLPSFVSKLLDQFQEENLLTWHGNGIPDEEIWIELGGDQIYVANCKRQRAKFKIKHISSYHGRLQRLAQQLEKSSKTI